MELELLNWLIRRWWANGWVIAAWLAITGCALGLPHLTHIGIQSELISGQTLTAELVFAWGLVGALISLNALGELEGRIEPLARARQWRARGFVLFAGVVAPALPILAIGVFFSGNTVARGSVWVPIGVLAQLTVLALAAVRIPWPAVRSFAFLAFAWWLPASVRAGSFGPIALFEFLATHPNEAGTATDSALWSAWIGSMFTFVLVALALDLVRHPQHEVRHPR